MRSSRHFWCAPAPPALPARSLQENVKADLTARLLSLQVANPPQSSSWQSSPPPSSPPPASPPLSPLPSPHSPPSPPSPSPRPSLPSPLWDVDGQRAELGGTTQPDGQPLQPNRQAAHVTPCAALPSTGGARRDPRAYSTRPGFLNRPRAGATLYLVLAGSISSVR